MKIQILNGRYAGRIGYILKKGNFEVFGLLKENAFKVSVPGLAGNLILDEDNFEVLEGETNE